MAASEPNPLRKRPIPITVSLKPNVTSRLPHTHIPQAKTNEIFRPKLSEKNEMIKKPKIAPEYVEALKMITR